ncbi:MAG: ATPase, T2SS/T4P/T4SS family [Nanoarchaeota archaeon]
MAEANRQKPQQRVPVAQPVKPFPPQPGQRPVSPQPVSQQAPKPVQQPVPQQVNPIAPPVQAPPVQQASMPQPVQQQAPAPKKEESFFAKLLGTSKQEELKKVELQTAYKPIFKIAFPDNIPVLPDPKDITTINVRYRVIEPFVDIHIYWDNPNNELAYEVEEPKLTEAEAKNLRLLEEGLTELINISYINIEDINIVIEFLEKTLKILLDEFGIKVSEETFLKYMYFLYRDLIGMNQVEPLLKDYFIEDIECNGFGTPIYIVHRKYRNLRTNISFPDIKTLSGFVEKLAQKCSQYVSYANPLLDGVLPDGSRVNATYTEDVTSRGPTFTLRKFTKEPWTPIKLMDFRTVSPEILAYLWLLIDNKSNILVIGGTGSGKTSFLNAMAFFIPPAARVVSIEDTRELNLRHENWLPAVSRQGAGNASITGEKHGEVSLFDLLKESLRQRPDYIIVGEIRGKEAFVLFQGMASLRGSEKVTILDDNQLKRIPIAELKNNRGIQAPTIDPITEKATIMPVAFVETHPLRKDFIRIKTKTGREVTVTPEHSVFTYTNKLEVVEAGKLKKGSKIAVPGKIPCGYLDIGHISLLDYLPLIRVHAPKYVKLAVKKLGFDTASDICSVSAISDYYANFSRSKSSSLRADKFVKLMAMAGIKYDAEEILAKFDKKSKPIKPILPVSSELLRLMGYFISDGSLHESGKMRAICLYNQNPEILEDMRKCIFRVAGEMPKERECTSGFGRATELSISHMVLFEFIKKSCGKSKEKKIPSFMLGLSKEKIGEFLSALYAGDGSLKEAAFGYYTISRDIADMLVHILLAFGIVATIRQRKRNGRKTTDYEIMFYGRREKDEFLKYVHPAGKPISLKAPERKLLKKRFNDVFVDTVVSIEKIRLRNAEPVYDISVPRAETFMGGFGGVLLHNTGHPSFGTFHAESTNSVIKRLMMPPINLSPAMIEALDALCIITPARVGGKEVRRISEIDELVSVTDKGDVTINVPFVRDPAKDTFLFKTSSKVFEKIMKRTGMTWKELSKEFENRTRLLMEMYRRKIFGFAEVQDIIHEYSKRPEQVLKRFGLAK